MTMIEVKLVETNVLTRWPCHVCGGCTEKVSILAETDNGFRICERCLSDGDLDAKLRARADRIEREAPIEVAELRGLIGRVKAPTYAEWEAAMAESAAKWEAASAKANSEMEAAAEPSFDDVRPKLAELGLILVSGNSVSLTDEGNRVLAALKHADFLDLPF
jgi:hypothetical protein